MTEYYVAKNGDDGNDGSFENPWLTIQYAINKVLAGDVIYVRSGIYNESVIVGIDAGGGSEGSPITIRNYQSEVVTISGGTGRALEADAAKHYYTWDGLIFDSDYVGDVILANDWNNSYGGNNYWIIQNSTIKGPMTFYGSCWEVRDNEFDGSDHPGNTNGVADRSATGNSDLAHHNLYDGNTIHDFTERGIWSQGRCHDNIYMNNTIYDIQGGTAGFGIDTDGADLCQYGHIIANNTIYNCDKRGIELENTCETTVENNIVCNTGGIDTNQIGIHQMAYDNGEVHPTGGYGAISFEGYDHNNIIRQNLVYSNAGMGIKIYRANGIDVLGNTLVDNGNFGILWNEEESDYCANCTFQGNIVSQNGQTTSGGEVGAGNNVDVLATDNYNLIDPKDCAYKLDVAPWTTYTVTTYNALTGLAANSVEDVANFINAAEDDYRLKSTSPAIDLVPFGIIGTTEDFDGEPRSIGSGNDAGCYEFQEVDMPSGNVDAIMISNWQKTGQGVVIPQYQFDLEIYWTEHDGTKRQHSGTYLYPNDIADMPMKVRKRYAKEMIIAAARVKLGIEDWEVYE